MGGGRARWWRQGEGPHPAERPLIQQFKNVQPRLARVCEPEAASLEPRLKAPLP